MDWVERQEAHAQRKRDLRKFFHEERTSGRGGQRLQGVPLPSAGKSRADIAGQQRRIQTAIRDCSKARRELVEMKRMMAEITPDLAPEDRWEDGSGDESEKVLPQESVANVQAKFQQYRDVSTEAGRTFRIRSMSSSRLGFD